MSSIKALSGANPNKGLIVSLNTLIPAKITIKETIVPIIPSTGKSVINVSIKETSVANVVTTSFMYGLFLLSCVCSCLVFMVKNLNN